MSARTPTPAQIRAAAATLVAGTLSAGRSLDELLANDPDEGSARGLKRSLVYGTLRWHFRIAEILRRLTDRPPEQLQPRLRALLEVGLFQLLSGETAPHAAVAETVSAARELGHARAAGFVNAVLRRFQRERDALLAAVDADLAVRTAHPAWFVECVQRERPAEAVTILEANNAHPPMWLRVNRRRSSVPACTDALAAAGFEVERHPFAPDALRIEPAACPANADPCSMQTKTDTGPASSGSPVSQPLTPGPQRRPAALEHRRQRGRTKQPGRRRAQRETRGVA